MDPTGNGVQYAPEIYKLSDSDSTQMSVLLLFDRKTKRVVSNESADIVRIFSMLSGSFDSALLEHTDALNARIYQDITMWPTELASHRTKPRTRKRPASTSKVRRSE